MPTNEPQKPADSLLRAFGQIGVRAARLDGEKAAAGEDDRTFSFVFSTDDVDSYNESIDANSWKLARFLANPVCLYSHERGQNPFVTAPYPIGFASNVRVEKGALLGDITISRATEQAETVYKLLKEGTLRAVSVGFMPGRFEDERDKDGRITKTVLYDCDLFEISVVMVPANPAAVALSRQKTIAELRSASLAPSSAAETSMPKKLKAAVAETSPETKSTETEATPTPETTATETPVVEAAAPATEAKADGETTNDQPASLDAACRECMDACKATDVAATKCAELAEQAEGDLDALGKEVAEECREASAAAKMAAAACEMLMSAMAGGDAAKSIEAIRVRRVERMTERGVLVGELESAPDPVRVVALEALGLAADATEADVTKAIAELSVKSGRVVDVEPRLRALEAEIAKRNDADAERDVNWLVKRSDDYQLGIKDDARTRKALAAYRRADPAGFASDYKAALDGLKAFDRHETFVPITTPGGEAAQPPTTLAAKTEMGGNADLERRATEIQEQRARAGKPISRSEALELAILG